jgi:hypothetical protein
VFSLDILSHRMNEMASDRRVSLRAVAVKVREWWRKNRKRLATLRSRDDPRTAPPPELLSVQHRVCGWGCKHHYCATNFFPETFFLF